jgi:hypothetical protein
MQKNMSTQHAMAFNMSSPSTTITEYTGRIVVWSTKNGESQRLSTSTVLSLWTNYEYEQKVKPAGKSYIVHGMMSSIALQQYTLARGVCTSIETTENYPQQSSSPDL